MTNDSVDGSSTTTIVDKILNQTLEEAISSTPIIMDGEIDIPMAFIDSNCVLILNACRVPQTFESLGELCVHANKIANYKYGENKAKLMEQIGVLSIDTQNCPHRVIITDVGNRLLLMEKDVAISAMVRLTVRIPAIHVLLSEPLQAQINVASVFSDYYSYTTVKRRSSSIIHIIRDIEKEYNTSGYSDRLVVSRYSTDQTTDCCSEDHPLLIDSNDSVEEKNIVSVELIHEPNERDHTMSVESTSDYQVVENEVVAPPEQLVSTSYCPYQESFYKAETNDGSVTASNDASCNSQETGAEAFIQHADDFRSSNVGRQSCKTYTLLSKLKLFINRFCKIKEGSKVSSMLESLLNIIEDPSSEYITQTLAYLPLGFFVKYGRLTEQSNKELECACFVSLLKIYEINMDLMIYNLSSGFSLHDFYDIRETYAVRYGSVLQDVRNHMCIDNFFNRVADDATSEEYYIELEQLYTSESNLYYRLVTEGTEMLDEQSFMRSMQIISQSRLEYPVGGIGSNYVPILENDDTESCQYNSIKECILSEIEESINVDEISRLWDYCFEDWHDTINELLLLAYTLSPHRIVQGNSIDIMYAVCQAIVDKTNYCDDDDAVSTVNACYESYVSRMPNDMQIKIMNRVNSILVYNILITDFLSIIMYIRDDIACITRICHVIDKKSGRNARYKSRLGIGSSLNVFEKTDVRQIRRHREYTDSERSRRNRCMNKTRYDDE